MWQILFSKDGNDNISHLTCSSYNVTVTFLLLRDGGYVPPFESWLTDSGINVIVCLLRLGYKWQYSSCLVLWEHLVLEPNNHAVRKPKPHGENMCGCSRQQHSWDQSQFLGKPPKTLAAGFNQTSSRLQHVGLSSRGLRCHEAISTVLFLNPRPTNLWA